MHTESDRQTLAPKIMRIDGAPKMIASLSCTASGLLTLRNWFTLILIGLIWLKLQQLSF